MVRQVAARAGWLMAAGVALLTVHTAADWFTAPALPRAELANRQGVVLDEATRALLTEVVFQAARDDDAETVREYLREGFTPNLRSARGDTLLTVAAYHDSQQVMRELLSHREIDLEARNRMGLTAVAAAAFKGHNESLRLLLAAGALVDSPNRMNQTAIMFAALAGRTETVRLLRAEGARIDRQDQLGNSPASLARTQGAEGVLDALE
jgi:ankyrin repeat protein